MRSFIAVLVACALVVGFTIAVNAHVGPTFFAQQVDPKTITIDGKGNDPGWNAPWWDDANTITTDMLGDVTGHEMPTVDDWDGIYKVGWSAPPDNMLYIYVNIKDDIFNSEAPDNGNSWKDDNMEFVVDADHQGGNYNDPRGQIAQQFGVRPVATLPPGPGENKDNTRFFQWDSDTGRGWVTGAPWGDAAITPPVGTQNVTYSYELKMAMWNTLKETPESSERHINQLNETIGLTIQCDDADATAGTDAWDSGTREHQPGTQGAAGPESWDDASQISDFVLIEGAAVTAVQATSWGAIKATFER